MVPLAIDAFSLKLGVSGDSILGIFAKGKLLLRCISNLTLGVTNEGREAITCGVAQKGPQHGPSSSTRTKDPPEGPSLAGRTTQSFLRHGFVRLAREEAERSGRGTSRGAHDASHDDQGRQAGASPRSVFLSSLVQREQAQARASIKGTRFGATRPRPAQRQGGSHCGAQASVTTRAFGRQRPTLVRISVPDVPLKNGQLLAPFPLNIWEEAQGLCL